MAFHHCIYSLLYKQLYKIIALLLSICYNLFDNFLNRKYGQNRQQKSNFKSCQISRAMRKTPKMPI